MLFLEHEIDYIYRNSDLKRERFTVCQIKRFYGGRLLYDYLVCSVDEPDEEGIIVGMMSEPTPRSMRWEEQGNQRIYDGGNAVLMFRKVFT